MAQTLNKNQLGHTRVGLSTDLKRAHIKRPRKKMTWQFSSSSSTSNSFCAAVNEKSKQIKSKQGSRLLVAEILLLHHLLLSLSLCLLLLSPYTQRSLRWSIHQHSGHERKELHFHPQAHFSELFSPGERIWGLCCGQGSRS
ncbi:hypothetical protein SO802_031555 [Lithocarpus litseifolius]|uniref:Uncharacterized protein n=1 Tax=Lithocarpus litseifolius TaxID=425828 RepID=A0AAW2BKU1_9ROSI